MNKLLKLLQLTKEENNDEQKNMKKKRCSLADSYNINSCSMGTVFCFRSSIITFIENKAIRSFASRYKKIIGSKEFEGIAMDQGFELHCINCAKFILKSF